jgi:hypothetical protein
MASETARERRIVLSADPSLSPHANELLTWELRSALGSDVVDVPAGAPHHETERHGTHSVLFTALWNARLGIIITGAALVTVGAVVALATDSLWALIIALIVHAICTTAVFGATWQAMSGMDHASPELAAMLASEGVADPDRVFDELLHDYAGASPA